MKQITKTVLIVLTLFGSFLTACDDDDDGNTTLPDPTSGSIKGSVNLYDEGTIPDENFGMTVTVEETSNNAATDESGAFTIVNVAFGTYTLVYEKEGYGTHRRFGVEHQDQSTVILNSPSLGRLSTTTITGLSASSDNNTVSVAASIVPEPNVSNSRFIRYFFSTSSDVSNENYEAVLETYIAQITPYVLNLTGQELEDLGFESGQTVYAKCYGESFWSNQYDDPDLGRTVFPNLNMTSADAVSFEVP